MSAPDSGHTGDEHREKLDFPVVGIGASAGGLPALTRLLQGLPDQPGMAFVLVMHLAPDHESNLSALLAPYTALPVTALQASVALLPDHVYVAVQRTQLLVEANQLSVNLLAERAAGPPATIDVFMRSLAEARGRRAIGVVMSGMGADGSLGLRRIKELGGIAIVQDPGDAEHVPMPTHAIATGVADFVLPAAEIGRKLVDLWQTARRIALPLAEEPSAQEPLADELLPPDGAPRPVSTADSAAALHAILRLLQGRTGHDFSHYKPATVLRRIERRLQMAGVPTLPQYAAYLAENLEEAAALLKDLLISVTQFFRDPAAFDALAEALQGQPFLRDDPPRVRAWAAGCATGEEAFSIAMLLSEQLARRHPGADLCVFASDIDERAIAYARAGVYPEVASVDMTPERCRQFFHHEHANLHVRKDLREKVIFATHNVLRDPPFSHIDVLSCRNLMIYLDREAQLQLLQVLHFALKPGGLLLLGGSESAEFAEGLFTPVDKKHRIYRAEPVPRRARMLPVLPWNLRLSAAQPVAAPSAPALAEAPLHQRLLAENEPASVVIDRSHKVLHATPGMSAYLRFAPAASTENLLDAVRPELASELHAALLKAWEEGGGVESRPVRLRVDSQEVWVAMTVRPAENEGAACALVAFDSLAFTFNGGPPRRRGLDPAVAMLEEELRRTREELRGSLGDSAVSNEELRAANEELQSINEELRSTTEELETSKEELQSVNEELITVNQELKLKVEEAGLANDDLMNLVSSTDIATIFVDRAMRIKRYTPRAAHLFNLISADVGRSLLHITHRLNYDVLEADAVAAFETLRVVEREVSGPDDATYLVRVVPYRTRQNVIDGAVLSFIDITRVSRAEARALAGEADLRLLVESTKDFAIVTMDPVGRVTSWNDGAHRVFGYEAAEIVGRHIATLFTPEDRAAGVPQKEMTTAREEGRATDERWHLRQDGRSFFCSGIMTPMVERGVLVGYAKIARDVTDDKRAEAQLAALLDKETLVRAELQRAITMKDEFLAVMSHELKHPLNLIHVNAELLARLPEARSSPSVARAASVIKRAVLSQAKITDDLLDLSRLRTGKLTVSAVPTDWAAVLVRVADAVVDDIRAKQLTLDVDRGPPELFVQADPVRIEQIVWNLVSNALKFTRPGGHIALRLQQEGNEARLDVADDGQGIAPDFLEHVFDMFRQADRSTTRAHGGMGIGLALVKHLVEQQGGRVGVASAGLGQGATFSVWLPVAGSEEAIRAAGTFRAALAGLHLLLVDDTADALESFATLLRLEGAEVVAMDNAPDALTSVQAQRAAGTPFDLMVSDVAMPGMDGYELVRRLRATPEIAGLPAIALTGFGRSQDMQRALDAGFNAHLTKPVAMEDLLEVWQRLSAGRREG